MSVLSIEAQMTALYEHCDQMVFLMKRREHSVYEYVYVNPAAIELFDETPVGKTLQEVHLSEDTVATVVNYYEQSIAENRQVTYRDFYLFADAKYTNETTVWPVNMLDATYLLAISKEMSTHKVLEEEQHFLSTLFLKQHNPMVVITPEGIVLKANKLFSKVFNAEEADIKGRYLKAQNEHQRIEMARINERIQLLKKGSPKETLRMHWVYEGQEIHYKVVMTPVIMEKNLVAISLEWIEQTDARHLEDTLKEANFLLESYKQALESATNFCITDANGTIEYVSDGYANLSGYKYCELIGQKNSLLNSHQHSEAFFKELWTTIKKGEIWKGEICNRSKRGTHYWVHTTIVPVRDKDCNIKNFVSICIDVTERRALLSSLQSIEKTFKLITENTNDFISITNEDGIILYVSPNHERSLGYEKDQLIGKFYTDLLAPDSASLLQRELREVLTEEQDINIELQMLTKTGETIWIEAYITGVQDPVREEVYQFVTIAREITERKQKEDELRFLAYHDALTMLPNRRYLSLQCADIEQEAMDNNDSIVVMYIDGDNFKLINDQYGHDVGDEFIRQFGLALKASVRDSDFVCRIGGDEFVVVLTHMTLEKTKRQAQILAMINRIQKVLSTGWHINGEHFSPTSSIGIAVYPEDGHTVEELLEKADAALYIAKNVSGKDSYRFALQEEI